LTGMSAANTCIDVIAATATPKASLFIPGSRNRRKSESIARAYQYFHARMLRERHT
jgi:hypothetical protein